MKFLFPALGLSLLCGHEALAMTLSTVAKVFAGPEGEKVTLIRIESDALLKKPHLLLVEGTDTAWDGKVFEVHEEASNRRFNYSMKWDDRDWNALVKSSPGAVTMYLPANKSVELTYREKESKEVDPKAILEKFKAPKGGKK
ncbi:MAG TPA: hypothetical protein VNJ01_03250 [Bacteriovoracaceae bacterium]|nr:hypothetical protein [Bacteriovoracaceae bacterium]